LPPRSLVGHEFGRPPLGRLGAGDLFERP